MNIRKEGALVKVVSSKFHAEGGPSWEIENSLVLVAYLCNVYGS